MTDPDQLLLRGRLTTFARRCGKPSCWCATSGNKHESPALVIYENGRTCTLTLREHEVKQVAAALARYEKAAERLAAQAEQGLGTFRARRQTSR